MLKEKIRFIANTSVHGAFAGFVTILICKRLLEGANYHLATLLAGYAVIPCFIGWCVGIVLYCSLKVSNYFRFTISLVTGLTDMYLTYYFTAEPVNGFTTFDINFTEIVSSIFYMKQSVIF